MSALPKRYWLVSFLFFTTLATSLAQIELYGEVGLLWPADEISEISRQEYTAASGWNATAKVLFGRRRIAPLVGFQVQQMNYELPGNAGERLDLMHLALPVGLAYLVRERSTSFNLMTTLAWCPVFTLDDPVNDITTNREITSNVLLGLTFTIDYLYIGGRWQFFPGGRFGTRDDWAITSSGLVVGVRW